LRENYLKRRQPKEEFEAWWEERLKERQRADKFLKARDKARRKMKRDGEGRVGAEGEGEGGEGGERGAG
jgi:hypothetical protein